MQRPFYAIGHISNDIGEPNRLGGGVSYTAVAARMLGLKDVNIITRCPANHYYIRELQNFGIHVHRLPNRNRIFKNNVTTFSKNYDFRGNRRQILWQRQEKISIDDLANFPDIPEGSIILAALVIGEVDTKLFAYLGSRGYLALTAQRYFRYVESDRTVRQRIWEDIKSLIRARVVIFSQEDITIDPNIGPDIELLNNIRENSRLSILTQGAEEILISDRIGRQELAVSPFKLQPREEKDFTGAGDVFAAAFIIGHSSGVPIREAATSGALYAGLKIAGLGGGEIGLGTLPTLAQIREFTSTRTNYERIREFNRINELNYPLGLQPGLERK